MHNVGQYYFVNFPALSLTEWHPYSVSSGPHEDTIELHIRDLGDHTKRICQFAEEKAQTGDSSTWILIDGPYGIQDFNYRRYPVILLAGGGIGVTPVMGMLKDIYDIGLTEEQSSYAPPHAIDTIYALWVMPHLADYECFREELAMCVERAKSPDKPNLVLLVYITRAKEELQPPFLKGRPLIGQLFHQLMENRPKEDATLVFACGPKPMVAELWDNSIQQTMKGRMVNFHHEIFDF